MLASQKYKTSDSANIRSLHELALALLMALVLFLPAILVFLPVFPHSLPLFVVVFCCCFVSMLLLVLEQYEIWVSMLFVALTLFPAEAVGILSGYNYMLSSGVVNISVAGYVSIIMIIHALAFSRARKIVFDIDLMSWALLVLLILVGFRALVDGLSGVLSNKLFDTFFLPVAASLSISSLPKLDIHKVLKIFLGLLFFDAIYSCIEFLLGYNPLLNWYYSVSNQWYQQIIDSTQWNVSYRSSSLVGHPLTLALYMNIGIVLSLKTVESKGLRIILFATFFTAILTTNSRGGLIVLLIILVVLAHENGLGHFVFALLFILIGLVIIGPEVYSSFFARDSTGSSILTRINGISAVLSASPFELLLGTGFRNSQSIVSSYSSSQSNIEIGPLVLLVQIGLFSFIAIVFFCYKLFISKGKTPASLNGPDASMLEVLNICLLVFLAESCTYNSIGDPGQLMYLFLGLLALRSNLIGCLQKY